MLEKRIMATEISRPKRREDWALEPFENAFVLYDPKSERVLEFSPSAAVIWQLCDGTRTQEEIATLLAEAYPDSADQIHADVVATLAAFIAHGSVTP